MAVVFLARDLKHDRDVALKVLRPEVGAAVGHERFFLEIKTLAGLSHPHILPLHDSGEAEGLLYYVMPYVDGESLLERVSREGQLSVEDALRLTAEVAEALAYAHGQGIIHRDIKPANIMLSAGHALVADFGIAAAVDVAGGNRLTRTGMVLGTPAYMSPEQSSGDASTGARSDVYSLGCVLYELLAGSPPFSASTPQAVLARHAMDPVPSLRTVRDNVPPAIERVVVKALAKVPADRFATAAEFAAGLRAPGLGEGRSAVVAAAAVRGRKALPYIAASVAAMAVLVWGLNQGGAPADGGESPATIVSGTRRPLTAFQGWEMGPSWSPDGSSVAYSHIVNGSGEVAVVSLGGGEPHMLTDHPADDVNPRWSPDGSRLAFVSDRGRGSDIYLIPASGGAERKLVETYIPFLERAQDWFMAIGATPWSPDGQELAFSRLDDTGTISLWKVNVETREQTQLTTAAPGGADLTASWSHDGTRIVFSRREGVGYSLWQVPAVGGEATPLFTEAPFSAWPAWTPDDSHLIFVSMIEGPLNVWDLELATGELARVTAGSIGNDAQPVVSPNGTIAYANWDHEIDLYQLAPDDLQQEDRRLTSVTGSNFGGRVSADGERVLYFSDRAGLYALWQIDRETGQSQQLNDKPSNDKLGDWSPDGREVVFVSDREGTVGLWVLDIETGIERAITDQLLPMTMFPAEAGGPRWAPDGEVIGYIAPHEGVNKVWTVAPDGSDARPLPVEGVLSFSWYRDSHRLVYMQITGDEDGAVELRARHLDTGEDVLLLSGVFAEVEVSPRGDRLSFVESVSHFTMNLHVLDLVPPSDGSGLPRAVGDPRQVTFGGGVWHAHNGGWSPDGETLVYSRDRDYGDIHLLEPAG
jgi:serine/threonine-protein kinase